jgi:hypothetical protein
MYRAVVPGSGVTEQFLDGEQAHAPQVELGGAEMSLM